jgi:hypothetical protein
MDTRRDLQREIDDLSDEENELEDSVRHSKICDAMAISDRVYTPHMYSRIDA